MSKLDKSARIKVGDRVLVKNSKGAEGIIRQIKTRGCQLHGDTFDVVIVDIYKPGHNVKKNRYEFQMSQIELIGE